MSDRSNDQGEEDEKSNPFRRARFQARGSEETSQGESDTEGVLPSYLRRALSQRSSTPPTGGGAGQDLEVDFKNQLEVDPSGSLTAHIFGDTFRFVNADKLRSSLGNVGRAGAWTTFYISLATLTGGISATTWVTWLAGKKLSDPTLAVLLTVAIITFVLTLLFLGLFWIKWGTTESRKEDIAEAVNIDLEKEE